MTFAHDTEIALAAAAALVNTDPGAGSGEDSLRTRQRARRLPRRGRLVREPGRWTRPSSTPYASLRPRLREMWRLEEDALVPAVNQVLTDSHALPQLVDHDDLGWHIHAVPQEAPLATRMLVEAAMAFTDVIRSRRARPAQDLRCRRLRQRRARPVPQPLQAVLRGRLRQPGERARLPRPCVRAE